MSEAASVWNLLRGGLAARALGLAADGSAAAILRTIARHAPPDARVLVLDSAQWRALPADAGFEPVLQDGLIEARCR
jgi:hypothetical protein